MIFEITTSNLINLFIIATGFGICLLSVLQVSSATHLDDRVRQYFQLFFSLIIIYIMMHLVRQIFEGIPGQAVRIIMHCVTFLEFLASGFMVYLISLLILAISSPKRSSKALQTFFLIVLIVLALLLVISQFTGLLYYFDADNVYHRAPGYLLSNLPHLVLMITDIVLLIKYRDKFIKRVALALWIYMIAPLIAIILQAIANEIQFIIMATVGAAVYMFEVIIKQQTEAYQKQQLEASRLDTELSMATRIQANMLPNIYPAFPEREDFDIYATMSPAKEVGGDFYDFFLIDKNHLGLVIADVSGKGIPAALFMMVSKILVQNCAMTGQSPKDVLEAVNERICSNNHEEMFVTVWLGVLDLTTGKLTAANAGHEYPALKMPDGSFELVHDKHGFVIGGMEDIHYKEYELQMEPGSKLFLYTDGIAEATNAELELFGTDRMIEALRSAENQTPKELLQTVNRAVNSFVKTAPQFDDLTMLCLEYKGQK